MAGSETTSARLLSLNSIRVQFGPLVAVRDVDLELHGGDLLGLIGPNGAGKTTLLRAAAGLQALSRGAVSVLDQRLTRSDNDVMRHVGFTADTPAAYEELSVRQFLRFIGMGYDLEPSQIEERIDFWLEKVWLTEKTSVRVKELSRGMRQRLGIARTLLPNPSIILLDEPAAGLDPAGRVQFRQLLIDLRDQGKAIIVSSHILSDMSQYCTHIGIMAAGEIVQFGTVSQIAAAGDGRRCRYTMTLVRPVAGIEATLDSRAGVAGVEVE
ncbi:MAG: ABC transporter ATP-binding protein, partial [Tepidisphaeraceae bacterium]